MGTTLKLWKKCYMMNALAVGFGSFVGGVGRYLLSGWATQSCSCLRLPVGTFLVNFIGCFLIGLISGLAENNQSFSPQLKLFLVVGVLGGFTTFSAFGYETVVLIKAGSLGMAACNIILSVCVCLAAVWSGLKIAT